MMMLIKEVSRRVEMASKQTYECFACKRNGFPDTRVYIDGKTEDGRTIYKNEDMSPHTHKLQSQQQSQQGEQASKSTTIVTQATKEERILNLLNDLNVKMNHVIKLLESEKVPTNHRTPDERRQVSVFLLTVLQAVISERVRTKQLRKGSWHLYLPCSQRPGNAHGLD
jgi:hypothetical protein